MNEKSYKVEAELPMRISHFSDFDKVNAQLQKFVRILEKFYGTTIWYIGMDMFGDEILERFTFNNGGFMEIELRKSKLKAFFSSKEHANRFKEALEEAVKPMFRSRIDVRIKEEFINIGDIFN